MKNGKFHLIKLLLIAILLLLATVLSIFLFPTKLNLSMGQEKLLHVILKIRLPEILIALSAGACLGLAGAIMQIILDNPLASPFTLGISSAGAFGAALSICLEANIGLFILPPGLASLLFSLLSILLLLIVSYLSGINKRSIILVGLALNFFFNAANTILQYFSSPDAVYQITFWTTGSLTIATIKDSLILFCILFCSLIIALLFSKDLAIIQQGERNALMYGVNVDFERILFLFICSLLASSTVAIVGIIGFVGLIAPHIARLLDLKSPRNLLMASTLIGSFLLIVADIISKSIIHPTILPISAVTSLFGIPILLVLLFAKKAR